MVKYHLACGGYIEPDHIGIDILPLEKVSIVYDLEKFPWTFAEDNSADEIFCANFIEHTKDIVKFMEEIYRILKPGAKCTIIAPYYASMRAWQDPTHTRVISETTFLYYNKQWMKDNKLEHYGIKADFDFTFGYNFDQAWISRSDEARAFAVKHYINVVNDIKIVLTKRV